MAIEKIEVWKWANETTFTGKETGKIVGGRILFRSVDPSKPVIWLNQPDYSTQNQKTRKRIVYYNTTTKMLMKPSALGGKSGGIDDMSVAVQQAIAAEGDTSRELGVQEQNKYWAVLGLAAFAMGMILGLLGAYLMIPHSAASTSTTPSTSSVLGIGIVNTSSTVHIGTSTPSGNATSAKKT